MRIKTYHSTSDPTAVLYRRCTIDLRDGSISFADVPCRNLEDVLGGFGRSFQLLGERRIEDAYCVDNPLIMNTGLLTGSNIMTGMRTYFSAYSPLKQSDQGLPAAMWSAGSGKFGSKFKWTGLDEVIFENRSKEPVYLLIRESEGDPEVALKPAGDLLGMTTHEKIMALQKEYPTDAHFAAIGPAGENYQSVSMGSIALSTENQLKSGEDKCRFAGRGGMGSIMGYKNLLAIVVQSKDKLPKMTPEIGALNKAIVKNPGSARFQPTSQGGGGGTWANMDVLQAFYAVPENNFRPKANDEVEGLFRENVEKELDVRTEGCFRCGIRCHNNISEKNADGTRGEFLAKFDYEPLNLFGTNLGIHNGYETARLVQVCDNLGMDAISLGVTVGYVLDFNERNSKTPVLNGATFGQYEKIKELLEQTGRGLLPEIGHGSKRLSRMLRQPDYAIHVKGLELPAYLPETNPGYAFAIAGGHMSMGTHMLLAKEGKTSLEDWTAAITQTGLLQVGYDMIGLCKFVGFGMNHEVISDSIKEVTGLEFTPEQIVAAVRRSFIRGLILERRQGYCDEEYTLPGQVFEKPNANVTLPAFATAEFMEQLRAKVWEVFEPEMEELMAESSLQSGVDTRFEEPQTEMVV